MRDHQLPALAAESSAQIDAESFISINLHDLSELRMMTNTLPTPAQNQRIRTASFSLNDRRVTFNNHIASLSSQLDADITAVSSLIAKTENLQRIHNASKNKRLASFWSFIPAEPERTGESEGKSCPTNTVSSGSGFPASNESRQQRIARLRTEAWATVGLRSKERGWKGAEHYERICTRALAELYGHE
jgi:hypothetical protein